VSGRITEKTAVIHLRVVWGTRKVHLAARFGGMAFLGASLLVILATVALCGPRWFAR
jgi:hypothetical protein